MASLTDISSTATTLSDVGGGFSWFWCNTSVWCDSGAWCGPISLTDIVGKATTLTDLVSV